MSTLWRSAGKYNGALFCVFTQGPGGCLCENPTSPPGALFRTLQFPFASRPLGAIPPGSEVSNKPRVVLVGGLYLGCLFSGFLQRNNASVPLGRTRVERAQGRMAMAHGPGPHRHGLWAGPRRQYATRHMARG